MRSSCHKGHTESKLPRYKLNQNQIPLLKLHHGAWSAIRKSLKSTLGAKSTKSIITSILVLSFERDRSDTSHILWG